MPVDLSVVIPSFNSRASIAACLVAIREQELQPDETILIDSSTDGTADYVAREFPEVRLLRLDSPTPPGKARNLGVEEAASDWIAFTSADCAPHRRWLLELAGAATEERTPGVAGSIIGPAFEGWEARLNRSMQFSRYGIDRPPGWVTSGSGCNLLLDKESLLAVGGFPEQPRCPDSLLARHYTAAHGPLRYEPAAIVLHIGPSRLREILRRQRTQGSGFAASRLAEPDIPGALAVHHPLLLPLLPVAKWGVTLGRLWRYDRPLLVSCLGHPVAWALCHNAWARGVASGIRDSPDRVPEITPAVEQPKPKRVGGS